MRKGTKHSEETRMKMREHKFSEEHKKNISNSLKGIIPWNKGLTKETDIRVLENSYKPPDFGIKRLGENNPFYGRNHTKDSIEKMSNKMFKYGWVGYWHDKAFEMFGSYICELCNKPETKTWRGQLVRLSMHCISEPKDYTIMTKDNWMCVCHNCHSKKLDAHK